MNRILSQRGDTPWLGLSRLASGARQVLLLPLIVSAVIAVGVGLVAASPAAADATCGNLTSGHCYNVMGWADAAQNEGIYGNLNVECQYIDDPSDNFGTEEIWEGTDNSTNAGQYWVEMGMYSGYPVGSGRAMFWANENLDAGGTPYFHQITGVTASINTTYGLLLQYAGSDEWTVDINGFNYGIAEDSPPYSEFIEGGSERTTETSRLAANFSGLGWYTTDGLPTAGWQGTVTTNGGGSVSVGGSPFSSFANYYDGTGTCTTSDVATGSASMNGSYAAATVGTVDAPAPVPSADLSATTAKGLLGVTQSFTSWLGDPTPGNITEVPTTRAAANALMGAGQVNTANGEPDTTGVYLVQATGRFTPSSGLVPNGEAAPSTGSSVWLTVDPSTDQILDWHVSQTPVVESQLETLGAATQLEEPTS